MSPSVHDNYLVSYEVHPEDRTIVASRIRWSATSDRRRWIGGAFLMDFGDGRVLQVDPPWHHDLGDRVSFVGGPPPTKEDFERHKAGGPHISSSLSVRLGGCNVVYVDVSHPYAAYPITTPAPKTGS